MIDGALGGRGAESSSVALVRNEPSRLVPAQSSSAGHERHLPMHLALSKQSLP